MKTLKELAAAEIARHEREGRLERKAFDDTLGHIAELRELVGRERAKKDVEERDVKACVKDLRDVSVLLQKRSRSWEERVETLRALRPQVATDETADREWQSLKRKAEASYRKYDGLYEELKKLQQELRRTTKLQQMVDATTLLSLANELRSTIQVAVKMLR